jgi:hypothetical protein
MTPFKTICFKSRPQIWPSSISSSQTPDNELVEALCDLIETFGGVPQPSMKRQNKQGNRKI